MCGNLLLLLLLLWCRLIAVAAAAALAEVVLLQRLVAWLVWQHQWQLAAAAAATMLSSKGQGLQQHQQQLARLWARGVKRPGLLRGNTIRWCHLDSSRRAALGPN